MRLLNILIDLFFIFPRGFFETKRRQCVETIFNASCRFASLAWLEEEMKVNWTAFTPPAQCKLRFWFSLNFIKRLCFLFSFSPFELLLLLLGVHGIKQSHWSSGSKPFFSSFCLSGAQRDSIRTSLTLSWGQSTVRAGGFTTSLSHAKKREEGRKKNLRVIQQDTHGAFPYIISCALCKNNPLLITKKGVVVIWIGHGSSWWDYNDLLASWEVSDFSLPSLCVHFPSRQNPAARLTVFLMQFYAS